MLHDVKSYKVETVVDDGFVLQKVSYDGAIVHIPLIDYNTLARKNESMKKALAREKLQRETVEARAKEAMDVCADLKYWRTYSDSGKNSTNKDCGRLSDAMMLANAVRGKSLEEIQAQQYPYNKSGAVRKYNRSKVFAALSVKKSDDLERINSLLSDFPEVFKDIPTEDVYAWMQKKSSKGKGGKG